MRAFSCDDKFNINSELETFLLKELTSTIMACLKAVFSSEPLKCNETENCSINTCLESSVKFLASGTFSNSSGNFHSCSYLVNLGNEISVCT